MTVIIRIVKYCLIIEGIDLHSTQTILYFIDQ